MDNSKVAFEWYKVSGWFERFWTARDVFTTATLNNSEVFAGWTFDVQTWRKF